MHTTCQTLLCFFYMWELTPYFNMNEEIVAQRGKVIYFAQVTLLLSGRG